MFQLPVGSLGTVKVSTDTGVVLGDVELSRDLDGHGRQCQGQSIGASSRRPSPPLPATPTPKVRVGVPGSASGAFIVCSSFLRLCLR